MARYLAAILTACLAAILIAPASPALAQQNLEDVVYLKDGSVIRGVIIEQMPGASLKIQTRHGSVFVYEIDKVERITKESPARFRQEQTNLQKDPLLAFIRSLILPGSGQVYNEQHSKGVVFLLGAFVGFGISTRDFDDETGLGMLVWLVSALGSAVDALISANRINQSQSALFEYDAGRVAVGAGPFVQRGRIGGALRLRF